MDRRHLLKLGGLAAIAGTLPSCTPREGQHQQQPGEDKADYVLHIGTGLVEFGPDRILSTVTFNGQFPGPLVRFKEGQRAIIDIHNDTSTSEQLHWHGQLLPVDGCRFRKSLAIQLCAILISF